MDSFAKTNGAERVVGGMTAYELEFTFKIHNTRDCYKSFSFYEGMNDGFNFGAADHMSADVPYHCPHYAAGTIFRLNGTCTLFKKENGWEVSSIRVLRK